MIREPGLGSSKHISAVPVDLLDEALEEFEPVFLAAADGIVSLAAQDGDELGTGLEEAAAFAHRLEGAVEEPAGRVQ